MKIPDLWRDSKYTLDRRTGELRGSRSASDLGVSSRLVADRTAAFYSYAIPKYVRGNLLDLGCGKAPLLGCYSEYAEAATLIDWSNSLHPQPLLDLVADLNDPLPLSDASFDTVILSDVLEHIAEPKGLLAEVSRVLKPDGVLLLNVPFFYPIHEEPFDYYRFTRYALERICKESNLRVVEIMPTGGLPDVFIDLCAKVLQRLPWLGRGLAALIQGIGKWLLSFPPGRFATTRTADKFPFGYALIATKHG